MALRFPDTEMEDK